MKNLIVNILNDKFEATKTFNGFESYGYAVEFAKCEAEWRGCTVEVAYTDDAGNRYSKIF